MANSWWRTSAGLSAAGNVAKGLATLFGVGVVVALLGESTIATVLIALGAVAAAAAVPRGDDPTEATRTSSRIASGPPRGAATIAVRRQAAAEL